MIGEYLQTLFKENKAIIDDRNDPIFTFNIPTLEGKFGLFPPDMTGWYHMVHIQLIHGIISMIFAIIIYKLIIPNRGTTFAYLLGWGILIPIAAILPFMFIEYLDIYNRFTNLPAATIFTCVFFRCIEAMYGTTSPKYIEDTLYNYVLYYSSLSPYIWDNKTKTIQKVKIINVIKLTIEILIYFCISSILVSWMLNVNFQPFKSDVDLTSFNFQGLFTWQHMINSYIHTWTLYCIFKIGFEASGLGENLKGFATYKVFDEPLTKSRSPTEFWTLRWNMMFHKLLKGGIFQPSKQFFNNTKIAILITFIVSGLEHDYVWQCMFYNVSSKLDPETGICVVGSNDNPDNHCYKPIFGRVTGFFVVVGITMILERPIYNRLFMASSNNGKFKSMISHVPSFVIAQLLLLPHLPFVHWYGGDWMMGGFFEHLSIALFRIRRI